MIRRLPLGIHAFRELRDRECHHVDQTAFIGRPVAEGKHCFLSRPRRLGKSLLLDTMKVLFEGGETYFVDLDIHRQWYWSESRGLLAVT